MKNTYAALKKKDENPDIRWILAISFLLFCAELAYGIYLGLVEEKLPADSISRVANAYYVFAVNPHRLSSIGFVWNPLPSWMELPVVAFAPLWKPLVSKGIASCFVTALFAALSVGYLLFTFTRFGIAKPPALVCSLLYAFHPYVFYYGANGMSEAMFMFFLIYCVCNLTLWMRDGGDPSLIRMAFGLAGGFLVRYETIPFALGLGVCIVLTILCDPGQNRFWESGGAGSKKKERYYYAESSLIMLYTPLAYTILMWICVCWMITGNPLYFLNSNYSNTAQSSMAVRVGSVRELAQYVLLRATPFLTVFLAIVLVRLFQKRLLRSDFFCLLFLVMSLLVFHTLMYWHGSSFGWLRFFCYSLPVCFAWLPFELSAYEKEKEQSRSYRLRVATAKRHYLRERPLSGGTRSLLVLLPVAVLASFLLLSRAMGGSSIADYDGSSHGQENEIVSYINTHLPDQVILTDVFTTYYVAVNVDHFDRLVISSDLNFQKCVADPAGNGIEYLLVPDPKKVNFDSVDNTYPDLYEHGADWCTEEMDFGGFKLFKVTG